MYGQRIRRSAGALGAVIFLTAVLWLLQRVLSPDNLLFCYVPLVLLIAIRLGRTAAVVASVGSFLAYNFFFVPPTFTLAVERPQDLIRLIIFLGVALLVGALAAREREATEAATRRAEQMTALYDLSEGLSRELEIAAMLPAAAAAAQRMLPICGVEIRIDDHAGSHTEPFQSGNCSSSSTRTISIIAGGEHAGELRVQGLSDADIQTDEVSMVLMTIANQVGLAIERSDAVAAAAQTQSLREADRLKSTLLSSLSHDLRTPLAAIKGAASNLADPTITWEPVTQRTFAETIMTEADRLNRFMRNLLEMSRLENSPRRREPTPLEIGEVIGSTLQRLKLLLGDRRVEVQIPPDLPPVPMDAVQIELVLSNLLENALKYGSGHTPVAVTVKQQADELYVSIADRGPGIPPSDIHRVFEKFYRLHAPEHGPGGAGLGLAISQGIVAAHGGRIWAENRADGGALVTFTLPLQPNVAATPATPVAEMSKQ